MDGEPTPSSFTSSLLSSLSELGREPTPSTMLETFVDAFNHHPSFLDVPRLFATLAIPASAFSVKDMDGDSTPFMSSFLDVATFFPTFVTTSTH
jgi:hypothetical protein